MPTMCAAVLLIIVMIVVFPVPMIAPVVGMLRLHVRLANYNRWSRHDHWRRLDNHGLRSRYNHWCMDDYDRNQQSQPNGDMEPSRMRGSGQSKACDTL